MMPRDRRFRSHAAAGAVMLAMALGGGTAARVARAAEAPAGSGAAAGTSLPSAATTAPVNATAGGVARLVTGATTTPDLCADVLRRLTGVTRPIRNTVHTEYAPFVLSKPQIDPLETQQYLQYEDEAKTRPTLLMCKGKSADHIVAVYGPDAAQPAAETRCRDVNRDIVLGVWGSLTPAERAAARVTPQRIMLDGDEVKLTGSRWITPFQFSYAGDDGRPHLVARRLRADWSDWRWKFAPTSWRGTYYCQLASPEYVRRLMLGETTPPPPAD